MGKTATAKQPDLDYKRVVVCGEVGSGKSTILNTLVRGKLLPDNIGSSLRPMVTIRHSTHPAVEVSYEDGRVFEGDGLEDPDLLRDAVQVDLWVDAPHLEGIELIEVPLTTAEAMTEAQMQVIETAHALIWVTISSQAWRLTEKNFTDRLDGRLPVHRFLALSRADKMRKQADRLKVMDRVKRETQSLFHHHLFVKGSDALLQEAASSEDAWIKAGGAGIVELFGGLDEAPKEAVDTVVELDDYREAPKRQSLTGTGSERFEDRLKTQLAPIMDTISDRVNVGVIVSGGGLVCVNGDDAQLRQVAKACAAAYETLQGTYAAHGQSLHNFTISSEETRLIFHVLPSQELMFVQADRDALTFGGAQNLMARMNAVFED